jgi:hypothetical protein
MTLENEPDPKGEPSMAFQRFAKALRALIAVPKHEINDEQTSRPKREPRQHKSKEKQVER